MNSTNTNSLRVLITNCQLNGLSGTEMYVYDLARGLIRAGHVPIVYSPRHGQASAMLSRVGIPVVKTLDNVADRPDIIHGHHTLETLTAFMHFPYTPGLFVCHDCDAWHDTPPKLDRIRRYVGVDHCCVDRLSYTHGVDRERITLLSNPVDTQSFQARSQLPEKPQRAVVFSSYATEESIRPVRQACAEFSIELDAVGANFGNACEDPSSILGQYDLVFAKGRCAREALAVGCAVIYCDTLGRGSLVTRAEVAHLNTLGRRALHGRTTRESLVREIARYDAADAKEVSNYIRSVNNFDVAHTRLIEMYHEIIDEQARAGDVDRTKEMREVATLTQWLSESRDRILASPPPPQRRRSTLSRLRRSILKRISGDQTNGSLRRAA